MFEARKTEAPEWFAELSAWCERTGAPSPPRRKRTRRTG
jgi:hypothetical protein